MRIVSLGVLVLCISVVYSKWGTPVEITSYSDPTQLGKTLFTDESSGVTHVAYCNSSDGSLYHGYLDESGLFLTEPTLVNDNLNCYDVAFVGPHDGQHIYMVMEARRSMSIEACNENSLDSCDDIYIFESEDDGQTWLPPNNIGGTPGDPFRRMTFTLLENWSTKYFWLVYQKYAGGSAKNDLMSIRYNTETHSFEYETNLVKELGNLVSYPLIVNDEKGKSTLIIFYANPLKLNLQSIISKDEGVTWTKGDELKSLCPEPKSTYKTIFSKGKYLISGCETKGKFSFTFSSDLGKTWTKTYPSPANSLEEVVTCNPEDSLKNDPILLILYLEGKSLNMAYSPVPNIKLKTSVVPDAFYFIGTSMKINCYYHEGQLKVRFLYQIRSPTASGSKYTVYIIDNDNLDEEEIIGHKEDL